ncbi:response regulator [Halioxenophilus aromaticivorans]|uniref:Response regulator n=1 Tax=Halioxenophilus aromaticivorans TaxID=1306992 RepID=A0AAV3TZY2_9ALTE
MEKILFVDDEDKILEAYRRTLRKNFKVYTALGAKEAMAVCKKSGPFPVIVVDMQMPEVNGVQLLHRIKTKYPESVRIMLTGNADQQTAIDAINKGDIFKFLNKPCPPDKMVTVLSEAVNTYRAKRLEKDLLESTVKGSIALLVEVLAVANPKVFGRSLRIHYYARRCLQILKRNDTWEIEATALLSQVGLITLSNTVLDKVLVGSPLTEEEQEVYDQHPKVAEKIVAKVPRLENIASLIGRSELIKSRDTSVESGIPIALRMLAIIIDLVAAESRGVSSVEAISILQASEAKQYDVEVMRALALVVESQEERKVVEINVAQLEEGMIIAKSISTHAGALLLESGQMVTDSNITRLLNFAKSHEIPRNIFVSISE